MNNFWKEKKHWILGITVVGSSAVITYLLLKVKKASALKEESKNGVKSSDTSTIMTKQLFIRILKDIKSGMLMKMAQISDVIRDLRLKNNGEDMLEDGRKIGEIISQDLFRKYEEFQQGVLLKYEVSEEMYKYAWEVKFKNDLDVKRIQDQLIQQMVQATLGDKQLMKVPEQILQKIGEKEALQAIKGVLKIQLKCIKRIFEQVRKQTKEKQVDSTSKLYKTNMRDEDMHEQKNTYLKKIGFVITEPGKSEYECDSPSTIYEKVVLNYKKQSNTFFEATALMYEMYNSIKSEIAVGDISENQIDEYLS